MYAAISAGSVVTGYSVRDSTNAINRAKALATIFLAQPGPKMMWEFQELGYNYSINRCGNGTISGNCRTDAKPARWSFLNSPNRQALLKVYQAMLRLRATEPVFSSRFNSMVLNGTLQKRVALRGVVAADGDATVLSNFGTAAIAQIAGFTHTGRWYEFWSGDSIDVTTTSQTVLMQPGETRLYSTKKFAAPERGLITSVAATFQERSALAVAPNPTQGRVVIAGPAGKLTCTLFGIDGRHIGTQVLADSNRELDLAQLPTGMPKPGIYLLLVAENNGTTHRQRLVVE
jgi:hypothetical protein